MTVLVLLGVIAIVMFFSDLFAMYAVYGRYLSDEDIEIIVSKDLDTMKLNPYSDNHSIISPAFDLNKVDRYYLGRARLATLSKWHIGALGENLGQIPRWSKWSKILDEKREELIINNK